MKNFKRVISAVIALALSASTLVAVSAAKFTDVDNTNANAEAIEVLTALGAISGYPDGSFGPEKEVTRAEAASMIVRALNMDADAKAAAGTSQFTDVNDEAAWATGYVNVGVAQDFIHGMDATTFAPNAQVTYAQMCVMLTFITGYADYAESKGGYPQGYMTMAAQAGINKGVSLAADTPLKRGQVAQVLYNAVTTPVLGIKDYGLGDNTTYTPQDGSNANFKTLLADKFTGYAINAKITATPNSSALDKGKVSISLTKDAFLDETKTKTVKATAINNIYADIDVEPYFLAEGSAVITKDANDEWHLIFFKASNADSASYAVADLDSVTKDATYTTFKFGSNKEVKIKNAILGASANLYVNNTLQAIPGTAVAWENLLNAAQGEVKFTKDSTGEYDGIFVDYYEIGEVSTTKYSNNTTTINFSKIGSSADAFLGVATTKITITDDDIANGDVEVTVTRNGAAAELGDIKEDDIIAVYASSYPAEMKAAVKTIKILATDATEAGSLSAVNDDDYTFAGTVYALTNGNTAITAANVGDEFTAVLDPFGKIYGKRSVVNATKYGLVIDYDGDYVKLLTKDGSQKTYEVDAPAASVTVITTAMADTDIEDRVITYTLKKDKLTSAAASAATQTSAYATDEYKAVAKKVGSILLSDDSYIIDATSSDLYTTASPSGKKIRTANLSTFSALTDKVKYDAFAWDRTSDNTNAFVIVTKAGSAIGADSRFAVGKSTTGKLSEDDATVFTVTALYDGAEKELKIADTAKVYNYVGASATVAPAVATMTAATNLQGKAFYYTTDSDNYVDNIYIIFNAYAPAATANTVAALGKTFPVADALVDGSNWTSVLTNASEDIRLVYGLVSDADSTGVTFVNTASVDPYGLGKNFIDMTDLYKFNYAADAAKYSYNVNSTATKEADKIYEEGIAKSNFKNFEYVNDSSIVWKKAAGAATADASIAKAADDDAWTDNANYAFAMIVNEQVVAIYQIVK